MPILPEGFVDRAINSSDISLIVDSWRASGLKPFLAGEYQPFEHLDATIKQAIKTSNIKLLKRIWHAECGKIMNKALDSGLIRVICDDSDLSIIAAWQSVCQGARYSYVKQLMRGYGIEEYLASL